MTYEYAGKLQRISLGLLLLGHAVAILFFMGGAAAVGGSVFGYLGSFSTIAAWILVIVEAAAGIGILARNRMFESAWAGVIVMVGSILIIHYGNLVQVLIHFVLAAGYFNLAAQTRPRKRRARRRK